MRKNNMIKTYWENGNLWYIGNYVNKKRHGEWKFFWGNGNLHQKINYKNGKPHDEWKWFDENGSLIGLGNWPENFPW